MMGNSILKRTEANPEVTVLMAVYNGEHFLREAIDSILNQTYTDFEFLIVNDASNDRTSEILLSYTDHRIKIINNEKNHGLTRALNKGLSIAKGKYIARQDADDISHRQRFEKQVAFLQSNPRVVLLGTQARIIDEKSRVYKNQGETKALSHKAILYQFLFENPFIHTSVMFRKNIIYDELKGYNETFVYNQDFELWSRVIKHYEVSNLSEMLVDFRNNSQSITKVSDQKLKAFNENFYRNVEVQIGNLSTILTDNSFGNWPKYWTQLNVPYVSIYKISASELISLIPKIRKKFLAVHEIELLLEKNVSSITANIYFKLAMLLAKSSKKEAFMAFRYGFKYNYENGIILFPEFLFRITNLLFFGKLFKKTVNSVSNFFKKSQYKL